MVSVREDSKSYVSMALLAASCVYQTVRDFSPILRPGFILAESIPEKVQNSSIGRWVAGRQADLVSFKTSAVERLQDQKKFYSAALKSWLQNESLTDYLKHLEGYYEQGWNESLSNLARKFYDYCSRIQAVDDGLYYVAYALSEGSEQISKAMVAAWQELKVLSPRQYTVLLRKKLGDLWSDSLREQGRIFYSIASVEDEVKSLESRASSTATDLVTLSKNVANQTYETVFETLNRVSFWTLDNFDNYVVAFIAPPSNEEQQYRGVQRFKSIAGRLRNEVSELATRQAEYVGSFKIVQVLDAKFGVKSKIGSVAEGYNYITTMSSEDLLAKTWPEDAKLLMDRICDTLHISFVSTKFSVHIWAKLDQDSDGKVTLGDLYLTLKKVKEISPRSVLKQLWSKFQVSKFNGPVAINGDLSS